MEVTVNMTAEEFLEFVAWGKDRDYYKSRLDKELNKREILAKKNVLGNRRRSEEARQGQNH